MRAATDDVQRRTVRVLIAGQVLGGIGVGGGISVGGLIAEDVSGSTALSGLVQTAGVLGAAVAALPMARVMAAYGRRPGLVGGHLAALAGTLLVIFGTVVEVFPLVLLGGALMGCGTATNLQSRYAATDLADADHRARALAVVVGATTVGIVLGPNLTGPGGTLADSVGLPVLTGPLLFSVAAFALAVVVVGVGLRPDPLLEARRRVALPADGEPAPATKRVTFGEALAVVRRSRPATLGVTAVVLSHTVMVAVMVMTPVHMSHHGASLRVVGFVISVHVAGMFALAPVFGWLADRLGRVAVVLLGQALLVSALIVSGLAPDHQHAVLGVGLTLLGLGWSCGLVAGSTLLSESVPDAARPAAQGVTDFLMGMAGATGGALAGVVVAQSGFGTLTVLSGLLVLPVLVLVMKSGRGAVPGRSVLTPWG